MILFKPVFSCSQYLSERSTKAWLAQDKVLLTDQVKQVRSFELLQNLLVDTSRIRFLFSGFFY
jgi:hypothetical protein